jgi:protein-tyrosine phosphatase
MVRFTTCAFPLDTRSIFKPIVAWPHAGRLCLVPGAGKPPRQPGLRPMRKLLFGLILPAAAIFAGWLIMQDRQGRLVWDHWDVAKRGVLYRSGQLTGNQLTAAVKRHGIRTVVNLQMPGDELSAERELSARLGVDFVNLPMPGDGFGEEWQFREILKIIDDPQRRPVLVHCARGTCRTGAAVALYRFERDGWTLDDVATEMQRQTYHYGWLPGYVYAMAKNKPQLSGPRPEMVIDRNQLADLSPRTPEFVVKEAHHER